MPERKWIHRSRNRKPDSLNNAIEPSLERTAGQALRSLVVFVVEILVLLFVLLDITLGLELVLVEIIIIVVVIVFIVVIIIVVEVVEVVVEILVVFVVLVGVRFVLVDILVIQLGQGVALVTSPRPIAQPCHQKLLRTIPVSK